MKAILDSNDWYNCRLRQEIEILSIQHSNSQVFLEAHKKLLLSYGVDSIYLTKDGIVLKIVDKERWLLKIIAGMPARTFSLE